MLRFPFARPIVPDAGQTVLIHEAAEIAADAYNDEPKFGPATVFSEGSQFGYGRDRAADVMLAFRGTDDPTDAIMDVECYKSSFHDTRVHHGFEKAWKELKPAVWDFMVLTAFQTGKPVTIYGHSLGAAIAALCAMDLADSNIKVAGFTFGQPRVGGWSWLRKWDKVIGHDQWVRVVNHLDIVTRLPTINYFHVGRPAYLQPTDANGQRLWSQWTSKKCKFRISKHDVEDHRMTAYIEAIKGAAEGTQR